MHGNGTFVCIACTSDFTVINTIGNFCWYLKYALPGQVSRDLFDKVCAVWHLAIYSSSKKKSSHGEEFGTL